MLRKKFSVKVMTNDDKQHDVEIWTNSSQQAILIASSIAYPFGIREVTCKGIVLPLEGE